MTGNIYSVDAAGPLPCRITDGPGLTTAVSDMETAFVDAAGRAPDVTELGAGNIGGMTLDAGVYKWGTGLLIPTDLALNGDANAVWIFQIAGDLTVSNAVNVSLSGGALPKNIFWQVSGEVNLGTTSHFEGIVLGQTAIVFGNLSSINGRLLAQSAVTLDASASVSGSGNLTFLFMVLAGGKVPAVLQTSNNPRAIIQFVNGPGTYNLQLIVTDGAGVKATQNITLTYTGV